MTAPRLALLTPGLLKGILSPDVDCTFFHTRLYILLIFNILICSGCRIGNILLSDKQWYDPDDERQACLCYGDCAIEVTGNEVKGGENRISVVIKFAHGKTANTVGKEFTLLCSNIPVHYGSLILFMIAKMDGALEEDITFAESRDPAIFSKPENKGRTLNVPLKESL